MCKFGVKVIGSALLLAVLTESLPCGHDHPPITEVVTIADTTSSSSTTEVVTGKNCADLLNHDDDASGVRTVYPIQDKPMTVFCDQETDGGGWTVIQRRDTLIPREEFFRNWTDYQTGFGNVSGEFWLGLDNIHALVNATRSELYVFLEDFEGNQTWAKYDTFSIEGADGNYRLHLGQYSGNAGESLRWHDGKMFTTKDRDNDWWPTGNCADDLGGAWWYSRCANSNLNGLPHEGEHESFKDGIYWAHFRGSQYSLKMSEMKVRPKHRN